jgi:hypothetical protein
MATVPPTCPGKDTRSASGWLVKVLKKGRAMTGVPAAPVPPALNEGVRELRKRYPPSRPKHRSSFIHQPMLKRPPERSSLSA